jgi:lysophospholipid acyltransferase (LPLAT)-like uncharacterized protein
MGGSAPTTLSLRDRLTAAAVGLAGFMAIQVLGRTLRVRWLDQQGLARTEGKGQGRIFNFWHGQLLTLAYTHRKQGICVLVSRHRDGECITRVLRLLGFATARGSSSNGGHQGAFEMCRHFRHGRDLAVTPDGPRGPRHRVQPGAVYLAQRTGARLVPIACAAEKRVVLNTWDRFEIPLPFSKVVIVEEQAISVPRSLGRSEVATYAAALEAALNAAQERALAALHRADGMTPSGLECRGGTRTQIESGRTG